MKNKINFIKHLAVFLFSLSLSAQVSMSFQNVEYTNNGEPKRSGGICGTIDLRSSTSTLIEMNVNILTVRSVINNTDSELYVYSQKSPLATRIQRHLQNIPSSNFAGVGSSTTSISWSRPISFFINAADYNQTGGTLFLIFKSPGGLEYRFPCTIPIIKAPSPSFTLTPTTVGLACGDTGSRTFTVTPANIPSGVTPSYSWSSPGWTQVGPTTNSGTFQPSSGSVLPSTISVTPSINAVAQQTMTCTVTRAPFTSTAAISGANAFCTIGDSAIYTINAGSGSTVVWSSSNTAIATLSNATNSQVTVTTQAQGEFILNAEITNSCNQKTNIPPRSIMVGNPISTNTYERDGLCNFFFRAIPQAYTTQVATTYSWEYLNGTGNASISNFSTVGDLAQLTACPPFSVNLKMTSINSCGTTERIVSLSLNNNEEEINRVAQPVNFYKVYPNPSKDIVNIELTDKTNMPNSKSVITGELFDIAAQSRRKVEIKNNMASINVLGLPRGVYILNLNIDGKVEGHQVIVE